MAAGLPPTAFDTLMQQLATLPLWIKQVIYTQLLHELETSLSKATLEAFGPEHTLQLWVPEPTRAGVAELTNPSGQHEQSVLRILHLTRYQKNVLTITILNNWSLEQASIHLLYAIERDLITAPRSMAVMGTIEYLSGRTRLGEYLVKINRLRVDQLDQALRTQKAIEEAMGERTGIANVMINLGYIKKEDSESILFLKEESKKPFQWGGPAPVSNEALNRAQSQLQQALKRIQELELANHQLQKRP